MVGLARRSHGAGEKALAALYERHEDRVYVLCHRILGSPEAAAEATRETFAPSRDGVRDFDVLRSALDACRRAGSEPEREAVALRDLEGLSFEEIAELVGVDPADAPLLTVWARVPAATIFASPVCERALPLIAREADGLLGADSNEAGWLEEHLMHCRGCRVRRDALQLPADPDSGPEPAAPPPAPLQPPPSSSRRRGEAALAVFLACVFLLVVLFGPASFNEMLGSPFPKAEDEQWSRPVPPAEAAEPAPPPGRPRRDARDRRDRHGAAERRRTAAKSKHVRAERRRRAGARRPGRPAGRRAAQPAPPAVPKKKEAPDGKRDVARGRVEQHEDPAPQEEIVPEVAPQQPPPAPPTETAPPPTTETAPPPG